MTDTLLQKWKLGDFKAFHFRHSIYSLVVRRHVYNLWLLYKLIAGDVDKLDWILCFVSLLIYNCCKSFFRRLCFTVYWNKIFWTGIFIFERARIENGHSLRLLLLTWGKIPDFSVSIVSNGDCIAISTVDLVRYILIGTARLRCLSLAYL